MSQYICEEHGCVVVYEGGRSTKCPVCEAIATKDDEIEELERKLAKAEEDDDES